MLMKLSTVVRFRLNCLNFVIFSSFELRCDVQQNLVSAPERPTVRLNVKKSYDDGNLTAGTIGIIVGVVVAVILAVIAIALVFIYITGTINHFKLPVFQTARPF
jgi:hypothetical protein